jgi:putative membrane protein
MSSEICGIFWAIPAVSGLAFSSLAILYSLGWFRLQKDLPNSISVWHFAGFICGVLSVGVVWATPLAHLDHQLLTAHMVQHLVLMTVAAPLISSGEPCVVLRKVFPRRFTCFSAQLIPFTAIHAIWRFFTQPVLCWFAGTACVIVWHVPGAFEFGMRSEWWHEFEKLTFLVCGLLFWLPVVRHWPNDKRRPQWSIALYLFLATLPCDALSSFLTFCGRVVYAAYASGSEPIKSSALRDQEFAGSMMWVWVTFVHLIPAVMIAFRMLSDPPRPRLFHAGESI